MLFVSVGGLLKESRPLEPNFICELIFLDNISCGLLMVTIRFCKAEKEPKNVEIIARKVEIVDYLITDAKNFNLKLLNSTEDIKEDAKSVKFKLDNIDSYSSSLILIYKACLEFGVPIEKETIVEIYKMLYEIVPNENHLPTLFLMADLTLNLTVTLLCRLSMSYLLQTPSK